MDTKKLRQKVLDLAIRGKLVPQDPNDEPASVLLQRIQEEKERLIKEGKIKRDKKSDTFHYQKSITNCQLRITNEEVPFEIPESWVWCRLGEIAFLKAGYFVKAEDIKNEYQDKLFPCYGGNGLRGYVETFTHEGLYSLIGRQGALCGNINLAKGKFHATEHAVVSTPYGNINSLWFFYTLRTLNLNQYSTGAAQPGLSVEKINQVFIPLPPLQEQHRIVQKIDKCFAFIDQIEENKLSLFQFIKQTKSKVLDLAIRGKLVPQDPNDEPASVLLENIENERKTKKPTACILHYPFEVPEGWVWKKILNVSNSIQYGYTGSAISIGKYKMLRITDIQDNSVDWATVPFVEIDDKKAEIYLLSNNDIVFARTGATVGKSFLIKHLKEKSVFASYLIRIQLKEKLNSQYVKYFFESDYYWEQIEDKSVGTGQPNVNGSLLGELEIPIPPFSEQHRIVTKIEQIFAQLDEIENAIKA